MPDNDRARAALHNFIAGLKKAREDAGPPSYARLEKLSEQLSGSGQAPGLRVRVLAASTTHDILAGKRESLPAWWWVASFLAVLRVAAMEDGVDPDALGTVEQWKEKHQAARTAILEAGTQPLPPAAPSDPAPRGGPAPLDSTSTVDDDPVIADEPPAEPAGATHHADSAGEAEQPSSSHLGWADTDNDTGASCLYDPVDEPGETIPPPELTITRRRYLDAYGRTGMRLLRHAEEYEAEPAFQLATLLLCDDRPMEALYWLQRARSFGHARAEELCADPHLPFHYWRAADAAYQIGLEYEAAGLPHSAAVFFERAGKNGQPDAAYRAGLYFTEIGKKWEAASFFSRAAHNGHPHAQHEFNALYRQLTFGGLIKAAPRAAFHRHREPEPARSAQWSPPRFGDSPAPWFPADPSGGSAADDPLVAGLQPDTVEELFRASFGEMPEPPA